MAKISFEVTLHTTNKFAALAGRDCTTKCANRHNKLIIKGLHGAFRDPEKHAKKELKIKQGARC